MDGHLQTGPDDESAVLRISDWIWRPWYAKLWWFAIPLWWVGVTLAPAHAAFSGVFQSPFAAYLNVLFFPFAPILVLGAGFVPAWLDGWKASWRGNGYDDEEHRRILAEWDEQDRRSEELRALTDPLDPRSGALWVNNPINPFNSQNPLNQHH